MRVSWVSCSRAPPSGSLP